MSQAETHESRDIWRAYARKRKKRDEAGEFKTYVHGHGHVRYKRNWGHASMGEGRSSTVLGKNSRSKIREIEPEKERNWLEITRAARFYLPSFPSSSRRYRAVRHDRFPR